jgi:glycogen(starch) synthase
MRIAFISHEFPPNTGGGIGTYLRQVAPLLAAAGHDVEVFAGGREAATLRESPTLVIHRIACATSPAFAEAVLEPFAAIHRAHPFDVVEGCDFDASAVAIKRRFPALPYVCKLHTPRFAVDEMHHHPPVFRDRLRMTLGAWRRGRSAPSFTAAALRHSPEARRELEAISIADVIASPSQAIADKAREWVPGCDSRLRVFPYPFLPAPALLAIPADTLTRRVTFLGRIEERKGVLDLAAAIPLILARHPDTRFRFVGRAMPALDGGQSTDELIRTRLGAAAAKVEFPGAQPPENIAALLAETDLLVVPSHWESYGLVCCEGLAAARGVVGSAAGGMAEILDHGSCGRLVPPHSPAAIATEVCHLLEHPEERIRLGLAGRQRMLDHFSPARMLPDQLASYRLAVELCRKQPPP